LKQEADTTPKTLGILTVTVSCQQQYLTITA